MTTSPQDDLTAERAAAVEEQISDAINRLAYPSATIRRIVKDAIKQTRQEALREVVALHQEWLDGKHSGTFSDVLLDRLTREGVTG